MVEEAMAGTLPDPSGLVTEDDEPVDSLWAEKCQRLLTGSLYASWGGPPAFEGETGRRGFLATANVGLFDTPREPAIVPDVMVSTGATLDELRVENETRSYFVWDIGKPPEVVVEIVSDEKGGELGAKRRRYARMHVSHYVVWDPRHVLGDAELRVFSLSGDILREVEPQGDVALFEGLDLGVRVWEGRFGRAHARWLRFTDGSGTPLLTGEERAEHEKQRAEHEKQRAEHEKQRAEHEKQRADRLAARLRALGVDPDDV